MEIKAKKYFLAANSMQGFVSHFDTFYKDDKQWRVYIIKGGPGTGKSSFMKFIAARCYDKGLKIELCPCSSNPHSLDGLIIPQLKTALLDGTAPHVLEPKHPGVIEEIINLGEFWDSKLLRENADKIIAASKENSALHLAVKGYLSAAGELYRDNLKLSRMFCETKALEKYALNLAKKHIPKKVGKPHEDIRFIGGVTPQGVVAFTKTITDYCEKVIIVEDKYGAAAGAIMSKIRDYALKCGHSIITLKSPFLPSELYEHIIIPELSLAFCTENEYIHFQSDVRRVHARRFYDILIQKQCRGRMLFNRKLVRDLLVLSCKTLAAAKASHDKLEKYYIDAMDFEGEMLLAQDILDRILKQ